MEPEKLSRQFQNKIAFHGAIDVQKVLPFESRDNVIKEIKKILEISKKYRGWSLSPNNLIMPEVPIENVIAVYETLNEYRYYHE
jgi:uroporphyrinogen decarboxylase